MSGLWDLEMSSQIKIVTREMPVVYGIVKVEVEKLWNEETPDVCYYFAKHCKKNNNILIFS